MINSGTEYRLIHQSKTIEEFDKNAQDSLANHIEAIRVELNNLVKLSPGGIPNKVVADTVKSYHLTWRHMAYRLNKEHFRGREYVNPFAFIQQLNILKPEIHDVFREFYPAYETNSDSAPLKLS